MFFHNLKYSFSILFRNRMLIFWTYAFPVLLGLFFYMAFSNIESSESMKAIDVAVVDDKEFKDNEILSEALKELDIFNITYTTKEEAEKLLSDSKVEGYIYVADEKTQVVVGSSGTSQTIIKYAIEEINQTSEMVKNLAETQIKNEIAAGNFAVNTEKIIADLVDRITGTTVELKDTSSANLSYTMIEFYTLIAMTALYGGILGMTAINVVLANMSHKGKRIGVSPAGKGMLVLSSLLASYIVQMIGMAILFLFTIFALKVDYGSDIGLIILLACAGGLAGLSIGVAVGSLMKTGEGGKIGVILSISMLGSFLSGMMGITMKYIVDKNVPFINKINPASMITDGFYALYYYDTTSRYWFDVASLLIFSAILIAASFMALRRQQYDSI